ncbi:MAG: 3-oxoacyl-[acyl-carrier-protein] reductase [Gemmatimonadetes bacterium]|nr:3-oxoacyl-[acyl-carrier-protein] reductase [Gemmatimonadota bacterium]
MKIDLTGKVALVTGGGRGIGRSIATTLGACGATVAVVDINMTNAEAVAGEIAGARAYVCDVTIAADVVALVDQVEKELGSCDILVNNAGITRDGLLVRMKDEDWDAVLATNLRSAFLTTRAASRGMMKRRWGRIVNMASVVGIMGNKGQANYAASKAGLIGLTKSVAKELASRNVLCNAIAPGFIETEMTAAMTPDARTALTGVIPMDRLGQPADVSGAVAWLASDLAAYVTGQVIVVDGGLAM